MLFKIKKRFFLIIRMIYGNLILIRIKKRKLKYGLNTNENRKEKYIVSLASYAERFDSLSLTLRSILFQTFKPDKIIVWIDNDKEKLTDDLKSLIKYGVEYRDTLDGLKPHKKYYYAMKEFPNANIITVDDDLIYSRGMIKSLVHYHEKYPSCVCARRVHKILIGKEGEIKSYKSWEYECRTTTNPSFLLCATGGAGTLYPAHILPDDTFDMKSIKKNSLEGDDIWLKFMELKAKVYVIWVKNIYVMPLEINNKDALCIENVHNNRNDIFINNLIKKYPEVLDLLLND